MFPLNAFKSLRCGKLTATVETHVSYTTLYNVAKRCYLFPLIRLGEMKEDEFIIVFIIRCETLTF